MPRKSSVVVAVIVALLAGCGGYALSNAVHAPTLHEIDAAQFYADFKAHPDNYIFIDVRQPSSYQNEHAQGAENIPIASLTTERDQLPKSGKTIVLICSDGKLAAIAYGYLEHYGFHNLLHIQNGLNEWIQEKLPTVSGASPQ